MIAPRENWQPSQGIRRRDADILTTGEVARFMRISEPSLKNLIQNGQLTCFYKIPGSRRRMFQRKKLKEFMRNAQLEFDDTETVVLANTQSAGTSKVLFARDILHLGRLFFEHHEATPEIVIDAPDEISERARDWIMRICRQEKIPYPNIQGGEPKRYPVSHKLRNRFKVTEIT